MNKDSQLDALLKQMGDDHHPPLPSPGLIWWRAQILRKQEEQARIEQPVRIMRRIAAVVCFVVLAVLVADNREQFRVLLQDQSWVLLPLAILLVAASLIWVTMLRSSMKRH